MTLLEQQAVFSKMIPKPRVVTEIFATVPPLILKIHNISEVRTSSFHWAYQGMFYSFLLPSEDRQIQPPKCRVFNLRHCPELQS